MTLSPLRALLLTLLAIVTLPSSAQVSAAICGSLSNGNNGPFDYRVVRGRELKVVEDFHFNAKVENLIAGQSGAIANDLHYVLSAFPNHHRALVAMTRLAKRSKATTAPAAPLSVECYYERALRFRPDDSTVRMLFASYLNDLGRPAEATQQLDRVIQLAKDNPFTQYNVGLIFAEMSQFDRALQQAHVALQMGFTRPELKQKLQAAGKWQDPAEAEKPPSATAPAEPAPAASQSSS